MKLCYENSHSYNKDYTSCLMNFEIGILFIRFAIKNSFQKNSLLHWLQKRILIFWKRIPDSYGKSF